MKICQKLIIIKNLKLFFYTKLSGLKEYEIHGIIPDFNMDENRNMTPEYLKKTQIILNFIKKR